MSGVVIASVVEGQGEVAALPKLLYRIANELGVYDLRAPRPSRIQRSHLIKAGGIESAVREQSAVIGGRPGGILVMLDADDDCPATLGPELLKRARGERSDIKLSVLLPSREYESWFLAGASSISGKHDFPEGMECVRDSDQAPRDAKGWLTHMRGRNRPYKETVDQMRLSSCLDLDLARSNSDSFDKFYRDVRGLLCD